MARLTAVLTADWHVKESLTWRGKDILKNIDLIIEFCREYEPDFILHGGDLFDSRSPPTADRREVAKRLKALSEIAPTVVALGNHDMSSRLTSVDEIVEMESPWLYIPKQPRIIQFENFGIVVFPWIFPEKTEIERSRLSKEGKASAIAKLLESALSAIASKVKGSKILVAHATAFNAKYGEHRDIVLGTDIIWKLPWFDEFDFVCLGHIHKPQQILDHVVYPGSPERLTFGEIDEQKGFWTWNGEAEFHPLPMRDMFFFEGRPEQVRSQLDLISDDAMVKCRVHLERGEGFDYKDRFALLKIEKRYPIEERRQAPINLHGKTFEETMQIYWQTQGKTEEEIANYFNIMSRLEDQIA